MKKLFDEEQERFIRDNYLNMPYKNIAHKLGFSEKQVKGWINHNCQRKIRTFRTDYFSEINSSNKAYWLGFIYADGWVVHDKIKGNYELGGVHKIKYDHHEKYICGYKTSL